jgi:hypothetical protein
MQSVEKEEIVFDGLRFIRGGGIWQQRQCQ